jgi:hypothetical protein
VDQTTIEKQRLAAANLFNWRKEMKRHPLTEYMGFGERKSSSGSPRR